MKKYGIPCLKRTFKGCGARLLPQISESLAPYYYLTKNEVRDSEDTVNIDIGGGTTDVMFFMQKTGKYLSTSFKFAGSDIWAMESKRIKRTTDSLKTCL
jgi:cell division ATPase FtsA